MTRETINGVSDAVKGLSTTPSAFQIASEGSLKLRVQLGGSELGGSEFTQDSVR